MELSALQQQMSDPKFYQQPAYVIAKANARLKLIPEELEAAYKRWQELE